MDVLCQITMLKESALNQCDSQQPHTNRYPVKSQEIRR